MRKIKKSLGTGISMLLLLLFSVTVLPPDFLHNHASTQQLCSESNNSCSHSVHITKKAAYCWICAIHFDKTFTTTDKSDNDSFLPAVRLLFNNAVTGYVAEILYTALRGPPSQ